MEVSSYPMSTHNNAFHKAWGKEFLRSDNLKPSFSESWTLAHFLRDIQEKHPENGKPFSSSREESEFRLEV